MIHDSRWELDETSDSLESHELAHQWFGDFVTTRWWSHGWLNESFATYFQAMWDEQSLGYDDFLYQDVKSNQDQYYRTWAQGSRRPVVTANYRDKDALFDTYLYPRGGAVLHMLRKTLGEENWWRAINHYLTKYPHQPVETEQFRIAVEEATGQSMDRFFDQWLYRMGHPVLRVTKQYDAGAKQLSLTVRQEQKPDPASAYPQVEFFELPVDVEIGTASNTRIERVVIEPKAEQTFTFKVDSAPQLVNFDYQSTLIKELTFDKPVDELVYQLSKDQDVLGRIWAMNRLAERIKDKTTAEADKPKIVSALAAALTGDKFWGVRGDTATALNGVDNPSVRAALISAAKDPDARVRARSIRTLAGFKDPSLAPVFMEHLNDPSYATVRAAAFGLGNSKAPGAFDAFVKLMDAPSWRDTIKSAALSGLASLGDKRALDLGFRYAAKGNQTSVRAAALAILSAVGKDDPRTFPLVSEIFSQAIEAGTFQLSVPAARALASIGDPRAVAVLEEGAKKTDSPQLKALILQAVNEVKK
jgi:aminopeptidase N